MQEGEGLHWMGKCFQIIFSKSSGLYRLCPVGKEDDSRLEQRLKPVSDLGEKVRLVRKRNVGK